MHTDAAICNLNITAAAVVERADTQIPLQLTAYSA
jgi:hypothetical protein